MARANQKRSKRKQRQIARETSGAASTGLPEATPTDGSSDAMRLPIAPRSIHWIAPLILIVLGFAAIPFDSRYFIPLRVALDADFLDKYLSAAKHFGTVPILASVCVFVWVYQRRFRQAIIMFLIAYLIASGVMLATKGVTRRARPEYGVALTEKKREEMVDLAAEARRWRYTSGTDLVPQQGDIWLLTSPKPPYYNSRLTSFPSGHTLAAFCLAAFLTLLYPRLWWLWLFWAVMCGCARIKDARHYLSDVLVGGGLGWMMVYWGMRSARLERWTRRFRLASK